jgi:formylglycine-generating enzyme required for sulfatase activity
VVLVTLLVGGVVLWWQMSHGTKDDANAKRSAKGTVSVSVPNPLPAKYKNSLGMEFVLVPKGKFLMGGGGGQVGTKAVEIAHDFYLGKYEVTQGEWRAVMGQNPSYFSRTGDGSRVVEGIVDAELERFPVESVSWNDAQLFVQELNAREKRAGWAYRLPTEAEWEYACRGGPTANMFDYGFDFYLEAPSNELPPRQANFANSGLKRTCKVGSYLPNRLGLYDMHGNVSEWCLDEGPADPEDPKRALRRWLRGGAWFNGVRWCRAAARGAHAPSFRSNGRGLRLARVPVTVPAPAHAPFNAEQARAHQQAWATYLDTTVEITNSIGMKLALIPPGKFVMGSPDDEPGRNKNGSEGPQHEVEITRPFYIGVYPVTVGQFREFVNDAKYQTEAEKLGGAYRRFPGGKWANDPNATWLNPSCEQTNEHPVVCVSWNDAQAFCTWLSQKEGRKYALPTEAQWEYSCRAGSSTKYYFGDNDQEAGDYFWYSGNSGWKTYPVGLKKPNAWGLYEMGGHVRNWCQDAYDQNYYKVSLKEDPAGPNDGDARVLRGGNWNTALTLCRSAYRYSHTPSSRNANGGFRVVLVPASPGRVRP